MLGTQHSTNHSHARLAASLYSKNDTDKVTEAYDAYFLPLFFSFSGYMTLTALMGCWGLRVYGWASLGVEVATQTPRARCTLGLRFLWFPCLGGRTEENGKGRWLGGGKVQLGTSENDEQGGEGGEGRLERGRGARECQASIINTFVKINRSGSETKQHRSC